MISKEGLSNPFGPLAYKHAYHVLSDDYLALHTEWFRLVGPIVEAAGYTRENISKGTMSDRFAKLKEGVPAGWSLCKFDQDKTFTDLSGNFYPGLVHYDYIDARMNEHYYRLQEVAEIICQRSDVLIDLQTGFRQFKSMKGPISKAEMQGIIYEAELHPGLEEAISFCWRPGKNNPLWPEIVKAYEEISRKWDGSFYAAINKVDALGIASALIVSAPEPPATVDQYRLKR